MEEKQRDILLRLSDYEQQIQQLQQQLEAVEQAIIEIKELNLGLDELIGKENKKTISAIGKGIYAKTRLISEELLVDIGRKNFVKKSIPETKRIIEQQIKKLEEIKTELNKNMEELSEGIKGLLREAETYQGSE